MKSLWTALALGSAFVWSVGCSTTGNFRIPPGTTLIVTNRTAQPDRNGNWQTSPFFWAESGGAKYRLIDAGGKTVRSGKLKTHFRPASIFWPPAAIIYWPIGFHEGTFDLTRPGDGVMVTDDFTAAGSTSINPVREAAPAKKKAKKN